MAQPRQNDGDAPTTYHFMANINSLAMSADLAKDSRINIKKSLFGTKWTYTPTDSKLKAFKHEYNPENGKAMEKAINAAEDKRADLLASLQVSEAAMGNYQLEGVRTDDSQFVALRLYQYQNLRYQPVSPLCVFEGDEAAKVANGL